MKQDQTPYRLTAALVQCPGFRFAPSWKPPLCAIFAMSVFLLATFATAQNSQFQFDNAGNLAANTSETAALPQILGQPQVQDIMPGELASFSVLLADTRGVSYQWRFNGLNLTGANQDALLLAVVNAANEGLY